MDQPVVLVADFDGRSGYDYHAREIIRWFSQKHHCKVKVRPLVCNVSPNYPAEIVDDIQPEPWEIVLSHGSIKPTPGKKTVYFTMYETDWMPMRYWLNVRAAQVVVTPSRWNKDMLKRGGVQQIEIVPLGADPAVFAYDPILPSGSCIFGTGGWTKHGVTRKGLNDVIDVFLAAFPDQPDAILTIKTLPDQGAPRRVHPRIEIIDEWLSPAQLASWYRRLTAFISGSRGEGWGLMLMEAMMTGRPVVGAIFGGCAEFMTQQNSYAIPSKLVPASGEYEGCGKWCEPDQSAMVATLRRIYANRHEAADVGRYARADVERFTWEHSCDHLRNVLVRCGALR